MRFNLGRSYWVGLDARLDGGLVLMFGGDSAVGIWASVHAEDGTTLWQAERDAATLGRIAPLLGASDGVIAADGMLYVTDESNVWVFDPHL